ncbi:helix-turn-helix domain-containing protein [Rhodococcus sp. NPDC003318]|uniref:helix-turn-helix domain-containing protein n=1 Tax=Rhodococcus sp. NPDC003318 TaxID=3364503 RepID=UPI00368CA638
MAEVLTSPEIARLGTFMSARRVELALTFEQVAERGGPSPKSFTRIVRGLKPRPTGTTLAKIDQGLGWAQGSAAAVLAGGTPSEKPAYSQEDLERHARLVAELQRTGVTSVAARGIKVEADGTQFGPDAVEALLELLSRMPDGSRRSDQPSS